MYAHRAAVASVSLEVARGEVLALVGGSGSGKTTLLKLINRLLDPTAGRVWIAGKDTRHIPAHELRRGIGYVIQEAGLFPHMDVAQNVGITPELLGWDRQRIERTTRELLCLVELDPEVVLGRFPHQLSSGQRQRVGIARALAADPPILLLDEPFGALDAMTRRKLRRLFARVAAARELTAVLVTHDIDEALLLATRVAVMAEGKLLQVGAPVEILQSPAHPYVRELVSDDPGVEQPR